MRDMKRRLASVPPAALAAVLSLGPTSLRAQYAAAPAVVPVPAAAGAASPAAASARVRLAPTAGFVSPAALTLSLFPSAIPAPQPQAAAVIARPVAVSAVLAAPASAVLPDRGDLAASAAKAAESHLLIAEAKSENIKWSRLGRVIQSMERLVRIPAKPIAVPGDADHQSGHAARHRCSGIRSASSLLSRQRRNCSSTRRP